jgi:hypothetical protein
MPIFNSIVNDMINNLNIKLSYNYYSQQDLIYHILEFISVVFSFFFKHFLKLFLNTENK